MPSEVEGPALALRFAITSPFLPQVLSTNRSLLYFPLHEVISQMPSSNDIIIRQATPEDAAACGKICYDAFSAINAAHNFPCDFPNPEYADRLMQGKFSAPGFY